MTTLTDDQITKLRLARRISRDDYELALAGDPEALERVAAAKRDYDRANFLSSIDDPQGGAS